MTPKDKLDYNLNKKIDQNNWYSIWEASDNSGNAVLVKTLNDELISNKEVVNAFAQLYYISIELNHPNIIKPIEFVIEDEIPCLVLEKLKGEYLKTIIEEKGTIDNELLKTWWNQLADALNYAQNLKIIHGGINPGCIFIVKYGAAKLSDFGSADIMNFISEKENVSEYNLYKSPEQINGNEICTQKSDFYSLAFIFYQLLTKKNVNELLADLKGARVENDASCLFDMSTLPDEWRYMLMKYLCHNPADREVALLSFSDTIPTTPIVNLIGDPGNTGNDDHEQPGNDFAPPADPNQNSERKNPPKKRKRVVWYIVLSVITVAFILLGLFYSELFPDKHRKTEHKKTAEDIEVSELSTACDYVDALKLIVSELNETIDGASNYSELSTRNAEKVKELKGIGDQIIDNLSKKSESNELNFTENEFENCPNFESLNKEFKKLEGFSFDQN